MKIFVSYSTNDTDRVAPLVKRLEDAGVEIWIDDKRLRGGQTLWDEIAAAIEDYEYFVPILSEHSLTSEWFHREIRHAYRKKRYQTIPILISSELDLQEFPKWIAEKYAPLITATDKVLLALGTAL